MFDNLFVMTKGLTMSETAMSDTIWQWVYNKSKHDKHGKIRLNRRKIGFIIAGKDENGVINFGWSKCHFGYNKFDLERAKVIATGRLNVGTDDPVPESFRKFMPEFLLRCSKYFQTDLVQEYFFYNDVAFRESEEEYL